MQTFLKKYEIIVRKEVLSNYVLIELFYGEIKK